MSDVNARIVLWGIEGSGKTTTLETIHAKLREDPGGDLRRAPTRLDPTVTYEALPITLGEVGGVGTRIELIAVPAAPDQAMTRKQLLDEVDGIVLVGAVFEGEVGFVHRLMGGLVTSADGAEASRQVEREGRGSGRRACVHKCMRMSVRADIGTKASLGTAVGTSDTSYTRVVGPDV